MRTIGLVSVGLMMITLPVADAAAASNRWCAVYNRRGGTSENCGYATLNQCRAQVLGLGGWCRRACYRLHTSDCSQRRHPLPAA